MHDEMEKGLPLPITTGGVHVSPSHLVLSEFRRHASLPVPRCVLRSDVLERKVVRAAKVQDSNPIRHVVDPHFEFLLAASFQRFE